MASAGLRSWGEAAAAAKSRTNWKKLGESVVETLCGTRHSANKKDKKNIKKLLSVYGV